MFLELHVVLNIYNKDRIPTRTLINTDNIQCIFPDDSYDPCRTAIKFGNRNYLYVVESYDEILSLLVSSQVNVRCTPYKMV